MRIKERKRRRTAIKMNEVGICFRLVIRHNNNNNQKSDETFIAMKMKYFFSEMEKKN
jgi:hypothetical protein